MLNADAYGFDTERLKVRQIDRDIRLIRSLDVLDKSCDINMIMARLEYNLTKAYFRYSSTLRFGLVNPDHLYNTFSVFIWDASSLSDAVRSVLESACGEILPEKGPVIIAGVFPGKEEKSLVKIPSQNDFISGTLIDTVFHGCRLKLTYAPSVPITPETAIAESIMADPCSTVSFLINDQPRSHMARSTLPAAGAW